MADQLSIEMSLENAAFEGEALAPAIAWSLRHLADRIEEQSRAYLAGNGSRTYIKDNNGNTIGFCDLYLEEGE